jgi:hypothetical protein
VRVLIRRDPEFVCGRIGRKVSHPLEAIDWRLERADEHLATLDRERDAFLDQEDRRVVGEFDRDTSEYVFRLEGQLPDPHIGLVVGEFAHHLRATLDNLLWQLVLLRGGSPTTKTQFPICERRQRYQSSSRLLRGISADDRALIEASQPYHLGDNASGAYLAILAWLNNVDKHRLLHVGCAIPVRTPIQVSYGAEGEDAGFFPWNPVPVRDVAKLVEPPYLPAITNDNRTELQRVRIEPSGPNPEMKVHTGASVEIALSDPEHALILSDLRRIRSVVVSIVEALRPRFIL